MSDGVLHNDGTIECVWHGARYDCRTGAVRRHPAEWPLPGLRGSHRGRRVLVGPEVSAPEEQAS
jgi:nitrite reductase/ring-hydroxylating ferredoxin subunit